MVKRTSAPTTAIPTIESSSPKHAPISPLRRLPTESAEISVSPNTASQKYSGGPKASATRASGGARNISISAPTTPPVTEASVAIDTASAPSPRLAIG